MAKPKQEEIPMEGEGVAPQKRIKAIEVAADAYVEVRDNRMKLTEKEVLARAKLIELMKANGLAKYRFGDEEVELKPGKDNVKVKRIDGTEFDEGEDGEEEED